LQLLVAQCSGLFALARDGFRAQGFKAGQPLIITSTKRLRSQGFAIPRFWLKRFDTNILSALIPMAKILG
jgi:hypothetical protein